VRAKSILTIIGIALLICFMFGARIATCEDGNDAMIKLLQQDREKSNIESCKRNLKNLQATKVMWALDTNKPDDALPVQGDLVPYYIKMMPICSSGGVYTLGKVNEPPTCSIKEHNPDSSKFNKATKQFE
jgi:hypothetical protein